jgi:hypothetical protein
MAAIPALPQLYGDDPEFDESELSQSRTETRCYMFPSRAFAEGQLTNFRITAAFLDGHRDDDCELISRRISDGDEIAAIVRAARICYGMTPYAYYDAWADWQSGEMCATWSSHEIAGDDSRVEDPSCVVTS